MKRAFIALLGATLLLSATSCTLSDILGIDLAGYDMNDPWGSWEKVKPGVYVGTDKDYNEGDLIAKGTDGSILCGKVKDVKDMPREFKGYDAKRTTYEFSYGESEGKKYLTCTKHVLSEEQGSSMFTFATNVDAAKKLWPSEGVGIMTTPKKYKKVAAGGDFMHNYKAICQKYQSIPYKSPDEQLVTDHTEYAVKWINSLYPSDMDAKGWVVPYTGKCESFTVNRQHGWDDVGRRKILWGGCSWGNVTYVIATVTEADYASALEYVNKVKSLGKYNYVYEDVADGSSVISFKAWSDDSTENTEGYSGYIYPGYKITYTGALYNTLSIEFSVCYVTYV